MPELVYGCLQIDAYQGVATSTHCMWVAASTTAALGTVFTDTGTILTAVIGVILAGLIALLGLGFGVRHLRKYVTGRKF